MSSPKQQQKFAQLSRDVLTELAGVQESTILSLKTQLDEARAKAKASGTAVTNATVKEHLALLAEKAEVQFTERLRKLNDRMNTLGTKLEAAQASVGAAHTRLTKQRAHVDKQKLDLRKHVEELEAKQHIETASVQVQCERPRTSLEWEPEAMQSVVQAPPLPPGQLLQALDSPVIRHLLEVWIQATKPSDKAVSLSNKVHNKSAASPAPAAETEQGRPKGQGKAARLRERLGFGPATESSAPPSTPPQSTTRDPDSTSSGSDAAAAAAEAARNDLESFLLGSTSASSRPASAALLRGVEDDNCAAALRMLVDWLHMVLDTRRERELYNCTQVIEVNHLPLEIYNGFLFHVLPLLQHRRDIEVCAHKRIRNVFDIRFSVTHVSTQDTRRSLSTPLQPPATLPSSVANEHNNNNNSYHNDDKDHGNTREAMGVSSDPMGNNNTDADPSSGATPTLSCLMCREKARGVGERAPAVGGGNGDHHEEEESVWSTLNRVRVYHCCRTCIAEWSRGLPPTTSRFGGHLPDASASSLSSASHSTAASSSGTGMASSSAVPRPDKEKRVSKKGSRLAVIR